MNKISTVVFEPCLTEQGLADLRKKYPSNEVIDMTVDGNFKAARKTRTERNKLVELINRKRIDTTDEIKEDGDRLIDEVNGIYDTVVLPFETEDTRRKEAEAEKQHKHDAMLAEQEKQIDGFSAFITECESGDSESMSSAIDGITNIDCEVFHKDIIHKAFEKKKEVLDRLGSMLTQRIAYEAAEGERQKAEEKQREMERQQQVERKLNNLKAIPLDFVGKSSKEISEKLDALSGWSPKEEQFGELYAEAVEALNTVIGKLEQLKEGAEYGEKARAEQRAKQQDKDAIGDSSIGASQEIREEKGTETISPEEFGAIKDVEPEKPAEEIITRFFAGFEEFNPEQAEAIAEVIISDGVPGVTITVTKEK